MMKIKRDKNKLESNELRIYLKLAWFRKFNQVILGTSLCLIILTIILTAISFSTIIFWPDILLTLLFWLFLGFSFAHSFTDDPVNLIKPGVTLLGNIVLAVLIFFLAIFPWWSFAYILPIAYIISMVLFIGLCIGCLLNLGVNFYVMYFWIKYKKRNPVLFKLYRTGKIKKILLIGMCLTGIPLVIMAIPGVIQIPITIEPQDYDAEFAFWGGYRLNDSTILGSLNNHSATLVQCCYDNISQSSGKQSFINWISFYNNTYPNISFYFSIPGFPGGFVWDGNMENVISYAKEMVVLVEDNNLTNVKGLAFDIEAPYFPSLFHVHDFEVTPNRVRHDQSLQLWYNFFDWMDTNAPNLELFAINYVESAVDVLDNDYDLHYIRRWSFLEMNGDFFDEYAPMSYRGWYAGKKPYGDPMENPLMSYSDGGHYWVYTELDLLARALDKKFGNRDKMGVYLGLTNCSAYSADYVQYQNGQPAGKGYDNLVRDALIAKHFGVKRITIFLLTTVIENGYSMGGVFDSYGMDFLDRFNESVNGKDSTTPFQIWYKPKISWYLSFGHMESFYYDEFADFNSFLGILYISLLFIGNGLVAYYGWKKIKEKVVEYDSRSKRDTINQEGKQID
jgi:hypothetical protein